MPSLLTVPDVFAPVPPKKKLCYLNEMKYLHIYKQLKKYINLCDLDILYSLLYNTTKRNQNS